MFWLAKQGLAVWGIELNVPMEFLLSCVITIIIDVIKKWGGTMEQKLFEIKMMIAKSVETMGTVLAENALLAKAL